MKQCEKSGKMEENGKIIKQNGKNGKNGKLREKMKEMKNET